jgi:hypothetical protein
MLRKSSFNSQEVLSKPCLMLLASNLGMSGDCRHVFMSLCRQFFEGGLLKNVGLYSYSIQQ